MSGTEVESIRRTLALACHHLEDGDSHAFAALFSENGYLEAGQLAVYRGREDIARYARERAALGVRHFATNERIRTDGTSAEATSYLLAVRSDEGRLVADLATRCHDHLKRSPNGRWHLTHRILEGPLPGPKAP